MRLFVFLFLLIFSLSVTAGTRVTGVVRYIYPSQNKVYFTLCETVDCQNDPDPCGSGANYKYYFITDDTSASIQNHTTSYFFYSLIMYSYQFQKEVTLDLGTATCPLTADKPVNYMFIRW